MIIFVTNFANCASICHPLVSESRQQKFKKNIWEKSFPGRHFDVLAYVFSSCQLEKATLIVYQRLNNLAWFVEICVNLEMSISAGPPVTLPRSSPGVLTQHSEGYTPSHQHQWPSATGILSEGGDTPMGQKLTRSRVVEGQCNFDVLLTLVGWRFQGDPCFSPYIIYLCPIGPDHPSSPLSDWMKLGTQPKCRQTIH